MAALELGSCMVGRSQIRITDFTPSGILSWTNRICNPAPVYEIAWTSRLGGEWEPLVRVTNQTSVDLGSLAPRESSKFFRVTWVDGIPDLFGYAYYEDFGGMPVLAVTGEIIVWFHEGGFSPQASYLFESTGYPTTHPLGYGFASSAAWDKDGLRLQLTRVFDGDSYRLQGRLQRQESDGMCYYNRYEGNLEVWHCTITECEPGYVPIGSFMGQRQGGIFSQP